MHYAVHVDIEFYMQSSQSLQSLQQYIKLKSMHNAVIAVYVVYAVCALIELVAFFKPDVSMTIKYDLLIAMKTCFLG